MAEKTIPWWRKALEFALGGLRSGFGFFARPAQPEPLIVAKISSSRRDQPEEARALNEPSHKVVAAPANPAVPASVAQPAKAAGKGRVVSKREEKPSSGDRAALLPAAGSGVAAEPVAEQESAVEPVSTPAVEPVAPAVEQAVPAAALPMETMPEPTPVPTPEVESESATSPIAVPVPAAPAGPRRALKPQRSEEEKAAARLAARQKKLDEGSEESPFSVIVGQVYDGPMDLLLDLIRKQDIDIYDIPIATITSQFLAYVNQLRASDVDVAGDFIYTASLLIHIKSKMLLPHTETGPEQAAEDPRRELVERLLEHERFKNAAQMLLEKQMLEAATWSNPGAREFRDDVSAEPEIAADTVDLVRIFREILERARNRPVIDVEEDSVTVSQMIQFLARRLTLEDKPVALRRLLSHTHSERALIAMFLALLEMVRLQAILLRQDRQFSEIFIKKSTGFEAVMNEGLGNARDDWR
jgi:segregation and condensation protein A